MHKFLTNPNEFPLANMINEQKYSDFESFLKEHKLDIDEYEIFKEYLGRSPTLTELGICSALWSEHCSYKSSKIHLGRLPTKGENVIVGPGENAGVVRVYDKLCVCFKMESHNHPSFIEPYQGAATGVGGIMRDIFCMGARPIANVNCLRFGEKSHPKTAYLVERVVKGIGDYGNCIGVPTVCGNISFDSSYNENCLVNAMTVGIIHEDKIFKAQAAGVGNLVVYVGSSTGRDGIHGATMASDSFDSHEQSERSTIQVGDPFCEKLLMEATLEALDKNLIIGLQDMGAAGLSSSAAEMASRANQGIYINLDLVPLRTKNMSAYEIMLSESQERMLYVIEPQNWEPLRQILEKWQLSYNIIGQVTDTQRLQVTYQGKLEADIPVDILTHKCPKYIRLTKSVKPKCDSAKFNEICKLKISEQGVENTVLKLLSENGKKNLIFEQYDRHIGTKTVLTSEHHGAAVLWLRTPLNKDKPNLGIAISTSCNERYCYLNPKLGAAHAVLKCARMIWASGGEPLAITDCLNFGNPENPEVMGDFSDCIDGITLACEKLKIPVVSGNVSFYNETDGESIKPTPMIGMVGKHSNVYLATPAIINQNCVLSFIGAKNPHFEFGGSLVAKIFNLTDKHLNPQGEIPPINWDQELELAKLLKKIIRSDIEVLAIRDVGEGGVITTLTKMCLDNNVCFDINAQEFDNSLEFYFAETSGAYLIAFKTKEAYDKAQTLISDSKYNKLSYLGEAFATTKSKTKITEKILRFANYKIHLDDAKKAYESYLSFK